MADVVDWTQVVLFVLGWLVPTPIRLFFLMSPNSRLRAQFEQIEAMEQLLKTHFTKSPLTTNEERNNDHA